MSASTYLVETVHSSTLNGSGAMRKVARNPSQHYFDSTPQSSEFQQSGASALVPISQQSMPIYQHRPPSIGSIVSPPPPSTIPTKNYQQPQLIATISAGFEKGDYLIREERGSNIYFDFFEEAYNFACQKGYARMPNDEEMDYMEVIKRAHKSVPGGCRYNTGRLLLVLRKKLVPMKVQLEEDDDEVSEGSSSDAKSSFSSSSTSLRKKKDLKKKLQRSTNTLPTDSESSAAQSTAYSSASTSYADSWE